MWFSFLVIHEAMVRFRVDGILDLMKQVKLPVSRGWGWDVDGCRKSALESDLGIRRGRVQLW